eukprot:scpid63831/ scgid21340/ Mitochondrial carnitine/acylcarnitine carrier protein CACL; CACT-like; Solute carrier family 25 member 29
MAKDFVAGWCGGCAGILVGHPFDTVKVRVQTQPLGTQGRYNGVLHCFYKTVQTEGVRGLFKGMLSPVVFSAGINAIVFGVTNNMNRSLKKTSSTFKQTGQLPLAYYFLSGGVAGSLQSLVCGPSELIKTRMQVDGQGARGKASAEYRSPFHCARKVYEQRGLRGLFRGTWATCLRDAPGFGFYFVTYEALCRGLRPGSSFPPWVLLTAGGFAGMSAWLFTYPLDVVKSRLQAQSMDPKKQLYSGVASCIRRSYQEGGIRVFTKGLSTTMVRAFPVNAVTFYTVEVLLKLMNTPSKISFPHETDPV